jgi:hypothetical protein
MGLFFLEPGSGPFRMNKWTFAASRGRRACACFLEEPIVSKPLGSVALAAVVAVLAMAWSAGAQQASNGAGFGSAQSQELITHFLPSDGKPTALTVVDPASRRIAVYHVARDTGEIQLKSVRNIDADLGMDYWNSGGPLPEEIRRGLERQP